MSGPIGPIVLALPAQMFSHPDGSRPGPQACGDGGGVPAVWLSPADART